MFSSNTSQVSNAANYIEDVFSTYLYTGNGSTQTITNGIDLAGKGGLVWTKSRSLANPHVLFDTLRGNQYGLWTNSTNAQLDYGSTGVSAYGSTGYSLGADGSLNNSGSTYVGWTFRKQPKFFDVVTYTGDGTNNRSIAHALNATPGCIIVKQLNGVTNWYVYHRSADAGGFLNLNLTNAVSGAGLYRAFGATQTSTTFQTGSTAGYINDAGATYVAYLFAHDAGGFGLTGTDNVISCGSFTTDGSGNATVNLGYEPAYLNLKCATAVEGWILEDTMRGASYSATAGLFANTSGAEFSNTPIAIPTATGFVCQNGQLQVSKTYIYIAIRRGPMKVPTDATKVFSPNAYTTNSSSANFVTTGFPVDLSFYKLRTDFYGPYALDRLRGQKTTGSQILVTPSTTNETNSGYGFGVDYMNGYSDAFMYQIFGSPQSVVSHNFRRAPSFFDEVCYTGTGSATTVTHNLGVVPELMIVKCRSAAGYYWPTYTTTTGNQKVLYVNQTLAVQGPYAGASMWNSTTPTASVFSVGGAGYDTNDSGQTFVAYLFASCPGVSKVGSYTGNGSTQTINCGFTGGARFVMIKRTDSTGDWYVYDTARGMTTLTDPYLRLNSTAAESATLGSVTTVTTGFAVNASILAAINTNAASYIFLAIA